ncbi:hypothetical protein SLA2020_365850 [Shorea laevis]
MHLHTCGILTRGRARSCGRSKETSKAHVTRSARDTATFVWGEFAGEADHGDRGPPPHPLSMVYPDKVPERECTGTREGASGLRKRE